MFRKLLCTFVVITLTGVTFAAEPAPKAAAKKPQETAPAARKTTKAQEVTPPSRPSATRETQEAPPVPQSPQEVETRLTKNWGGARSWLSDRGVDLGMVYKANWQKNLSGGVAQDGDYIGNFDLRASFDLEKIAGMKGGSFFIYGLINHGGAPSEFTGDAQITNNTETGVKYFARLYEAWYQQLLHEERISLLVGLHDLNSEFYVTDTSGLFLNSSFGIGKEFSQAGFAGPSIFAATSPALRVRVEPSKSFYLQWGAFGARSGDPENPRGTSVSLKPEDGFLLVSEFAYLRGEGEEKTRPGKYGFGVWSFSQPMPVSDDLLPADGSDPVKAEGAQAGAYLLADQEVLDGFSVFLRYGVATSSVMRFSSGLQAGFAWTGLLGRETDRLGLGFTQVRNGPQYLALKQAEGTEVANAESAIELTYHMDLLRGIALQPDLQYVMSPNTDPTIKNALVGTLRLEVNL